MQPLRTPGARLDARDFACSRGLHQLFTDLSFAVEPGEALCLVGPNGSGKTTLLRCVAGLTRPDAGSVSWGGQAHSAVSSAWRGLFAYGGHASALKDELTARENLELAIALDGSDAAFGEVDAALHRAGIARKQALPAKRLSQGQQRRVGLARLSLSQRPLWLLDEPTTALDADGQALLARLLEEHLARGGLAIVATHQGLGLQRGTVRELRLGGSGG